MRLKHIPQIVLAATMPLSLHAQEALAATPEKSSPEATEKNELKIEKISDDIYALGEIRINKKTKEITFPAVVEMSGQPDAREQPVVEYVLVNPEGKIHESLFITDIKPSHLNVAFKLVGFLESKELFRIVNDDFQPQEGYEKATPEQKKKSRFNMFIKWNDPKDKSKTISKSIDQLIHNAASNAPMQAGPWVYGGSFIHKGQYIADVKRDLFAIFTDRASIGNYAGKGREDDTLWFPNSKVMPTPGTKVTFSITPFVAKKKK